MYNYKQIYELYAIFILPCPLAGRRPARPAQEQPGTVTVRVRPSPPSGPPGVQRRAAASATAAAAQLDAAIARNSARFALNRAGLLLKCFEHVLCCIPRHSGEILHVIFFVPRGSPSDVIKEDIRVRVDTIYTMLGLAKGQALIRQGHPLL